MLMNQVIDQYQYCDGNQTWNELLKTNLCSTLLYMKTKDDIRSPQLHVHRPYTLLFLLRHMYFTNYSNSHNQAAMSWVHCNINIPFDDNLSESRKQQLLARLDLHISGRKTSISPGLRVQKNQPLKQTDPPNDAQQQFTPLPLPDTKLADAQSEITHCRSESGAASHTPCCYRVVLGGSHRQDDESQQHHKEAESQSSAAICLSH